MYESTITVKGQTTIPSDVREAMGLKPGDKVRYFPDRNGSMRIARVKTLDELVGCLAKYYDGPPVSVEDMDEAIGDYIAEKFAHLGPKTDKAAE